jgi:hypothetical protein
MNCLKKLGFNFKLRRYAAVPATAVAAWLWYGGQLVERGAACLILLAAS